MQNMLSVISPPFLSHLVTFFYNGTVKVMYFSGFYPKQVNCFLNTSITFFMIKSILDPL